jgi:hypothetical protein
MLKNIQFLDNVCIYGSWISLVLTTFSLLNVFLGVKDSVPTDATDIRTRTTNIQFPFSLFLQYINKTRFFFSKKTIFSEALFGKSNKLAYSLLNQLISLFEKHKGIWQLAFLIIL